MESWISGQENIEGGHQDEKVFDGYQDANVIVKNRMIMVLGWI
jgi:hypothetical protein